MNWLDVVILIILLTSVASSFSKGFSREIVGLVSTVAAFVLALWLYGTAGSFLLPYVSSRGVANFCGFVIVFVGVSLLGGFVGWLLNRMLHAVGLSFVDRLLGAAFGLVRGLLVAVALVMAIMAFTPATPGASRSASAPRAVVDSRLAPYVVDAAKVLSNLAPHELKDGVARSYDQIKGIWEDAWKRGIGKPGEEKGKDERQF